MKRMSKRFYLGSFIGLLGFSLMAIVVGLALFSILPNLDEARTFVTIALVFITIFVFAVILCFIIVLMVMIYQMWEAIEGEGTLIPPFVVLILLLIPFLNLLWLLVVFPLYQYYYNLYIRRRDIVVPALKAGLFYAPPILIVIYIFGTVIYYAVQLMPETSLMVTIEIVFGLIGIIAFFASFVVFLRMAANICDAVNALLQPVGEWVIATNEDEVGGNR